MHVSTTGCWAELSSTTQSLQPPRSRSLQPRLQPPVGRPHQPVPRGSQRQFPPLCLSLPALPGASPRIQVRDTWVTYGNLLTTLYWSGIQHRNSTFGLPRILIQGPAQITPVFKLHKNHYQTISMSFCNTISHSSTPWDFLGEKFKLLSVSCETFTYPTDQPPSMVLRLPDPCLSQGSDLLRWACPRAVTVRLVSP